MGLVAWIIKSLLESIFIGLSYSPFINFLYGTSGLETEEFYTW